MEKRRESRGPTLCSGTAGRGPVPRAFPLNNGRRGWEVGKLGWGWEVLAEFLFRIKVNQQMKQNGLMIES